MKNLLIQTKQGAKTFVQLGFYVRKKDMWNSIFHPKWDSNKFQPMYIGIIRSMTSCKEVFEASEVHLMCVATCNSRFVTICV